MAENEAMELVRVSTVATFQIENLGPQYLEGCSPGKQEKLRAPTPNLEVSL